MQKKRELEERESADYLLYVITPRMKGLYSIAEVTEDAIKKPEKTIFCFLKTDVDDQGEPINFSDEQANSLDEVGKLVVRNGATHLKTLNSIAKFVNM